MQAEGICEIHAVRCSIFLLARDCFRADYSLRSYDAHVPFMCLTEFGIMFP